MFLISTYWYILEKDKVNTNIKIWSETGKYILVKKCATSKTIYHKDKIQRDMNLQRTSTYD